MSQPTSESTSQKFAGENAGIVQSFDYEKGGAYIRPKDAPVDRSKDFFVNWSEVISGNLQVADIVAYEVVTTTTGTTTYKNVDNGTPAKGRGKGRS